MQNVQDLVDRIPPEAWPLIDVLFRITVALTLLWLFLALVAWWRRRAYNLTIASTAGRSKKAQPDFLRVDEKARKAAIARGEAHEEFLEDREQEELAKDPLSFGQRMAGLASLVMSLFTLSTVVFGAVSNIQNMGKAFKSMGTWEKMQKVLADHWFGTSLAVFVIGWYLYKYFADRKWKES
ncbi:MAG TPA: hypothetical protein VF631_03250 [Allosphingosinicella sp.]|jgi:hypothetical protein|uniref:hypothetical protein n=1 Tax=Allosphingosinicella sp. TaxID=2823234 RepID=UPI002F2AE4A7